MIHKRPFTTLASSILLFIAIAFLMPAADANAQNGRLIESLFKTLAETQLEKERIKRDEAKKRPPVLLPPSQGGLKPSKDPFKVQLPSGFGQPGRVPVVKPSVTTRPSTRPVVKPIIKPPAKVSTSINVRSREAAEYARQLVSFNSTIDPLIAELRRSTTKHPELRPLLPEAYQIAADGRALLKRCDGISSLNSIISPYQALDARWRRFAFSLSGINGLNATCSTSIDKCNTYAASMCKQLQLQPQFDRHALHDEMVVVATYMQSIIDDLELSTANADQCRILIHDCRLLRQRLLNAAGHVDELSYDEAAQTFTGFVQDWGGFAQRVYALNNSHLARRLARVREAGDRVYAILWMNPPPSFHDVSAIANRLDSQFGSLSDQITFRTIAGLPGQDQVRVLNATRQLYDHAVALEQAAQRKAPQGELQQAFGKLDQTWISVQPDFRRIPSVQRGVLAEIERSCQELRGTLGVGGDSGIPITAAQLIQAAAALEGTAEFINDSLRRDSRDLTPGSYRSSVTSAAREFYTHSRELHEEVSKPGRLTDARYLGRLQREAERMLEGWQQLARDLDHIQDHGLSRSKAAQIKRAQRDITPFVAQVAAALLEG